VTGPGWIAAVDAPAKVNLRLMVLAREQSGFHSLETVFCALDLADRVTVEHTGRAGVELEVLGGVDTGPPERNLVVRAARHFHEELGLQPAIRIRLEKTIPSAAGLGGGSSDAAATLRALNAALGDPVEPGTLLRWGAAVGSDVPFFLGGSTLSLAWGRGQRLLALVPLPVRTVLVAHPGRPISTAAAFARIAASRAGEFVPGAVSLPAERLTSWEGIAQVAINHFETPALEEVPSLAIGLRALRDGGASVAMLAGSGSAIFGIFEDPAAAAAVEHTLAPLGFRCWIASTLRRFPAVSLQHRGVAGAARRGSAG
jgi:4-diphosphocytidyl-2-C-methyl-D-erythritol kinase